MHADEPVDSFGQIRIPVRYRLLLQPGREGGSAVGRAFKHDRREWGSVREELCRLQAEDEWLEGSDGEPAGHDAVSRERGTHPWPAEIVLEFLTRASVDICDCLSRD